MTRYDEAVLGELATLMRLATGRYVWLSALLTVIPTAVVFKVDRGVLFLLYFVAVCVLTRSVRMAGLLFRRHRSILRKGAVRCSCWFFRAVVLFAHRRDTCRNCRPGFGLSGEQVPAGASESIGGPRSQCRRGCAAYWRATVPGGQKKGDGVSRRPNRTLINNLA